MSDEHKGKMTWIKNRVYKKAKVNRETTQLVLETIADLAWDWKNSRYDLWGLCLEDFLNEIGEKRAPKEET